MIPLLLPARSEASKRFVARLQNTQSDCSDDGDAYLVHETVEAQVFASRFGLLEISRPPSENLMGDVVVIDPMRGHAERLIRSGSTDNTLVVTEQCDQLCVMCSQPPKKTHFDRFGEYAEALRLAPQGTIIGLSGGEPTLYKHQLFQLIQKTRHSRPDLGFHVLSNGQHFVEDDRSWLTEMASCGVTWGIPIYSSEQSLHDQIVAKEGAFERLMESLTHLVLSGSCVELRTVLLSKNLSSLPELAHLISVRMGFCSQWSIMQLERTGFARNRFSELYVNPNFAFEFIAEAVDRAILFGIPVSLFNFPRCHVPAPYRYLAAASISDWKRKYVSDCKSCSEQSLCSGFFEWQSDELIEVSPL